MSDEIETFNKYMVAVNGQGIVIMNPPRYPMSSADAILLAAWLISLADPGDDKFKAILGAVQGS